MPSISTTTPAAPACNRRWSRGWSLERVLFAVAGTATGLSALLAAVVSPWFLLLTGFVALNQWIFVLVGDCPMSLILRRTAHLSAANDG